MKYVDVDEARADLSDLLDAVKAGEEIVLCQHGNRVAILSAYQPAIRRPGRLKGKLKIADDFDAPIDPTKPWMQYAGFVASRIKTKEEE